MGYRYTVADVAELNAELDRLRAALTKIADHRDIMSDWPHTTEAMQQIARKALNASS